MRQVRLRFGTQPQPPCLALLQQRMSVSTRPLFASWGGDALVVECLGDLGPFKAFGSQLIHLGIEGFLFGGVGTTPER